jgi:hypothetical protein
MRKKLKLSSDGGDSGSKKCKRGCDCVYGGVWRGLAESVFGRSLESSVGAFGRNLASVAVKMFSHWIYFQKKFYKCTFNAICKDDAPINCMTVQHNKASLPSNLTGHTTLVIISPSPLAVEHEYVCKNSGKHWHYMGMNGQPQRESGCCVKLSPKIRSVGRTCIHRTRLKLSISLLFAVRHLHT